MNYHNLWFFLSFNGNNHERKKLRIFCFEILIIIIIYSPFFFPILSQINFFFNFFTYFYSLKRWTYSTPATFTISHLYLNLCLFISWSRLITCFIYFSIRWVELLFFTFIKKIIRMNTKRKKQQQKTVEAYFCSFIKMPSSFLLIRPFILKKNTNLNHRLQLTSHTKIYTCYALEFPWVNVNVSVCFKASKPKNKKPSSRIHTPRVH